MIVKTIALLGHKDHGKSTLIGSLLMQTGAATQARINEAKEYSKRLHKDFEPAFILDSFAEERTNEMTIDTTRAEIVWNKFAFAFIDVPGHEELIKNMISGASYGEIALLLVSAKSDEGIRDQTKRHLFISRMLGIDKLVVAVNKMDLRKYDRSAFESVEKELGSYIQKIGFKKENVSFVPVSAYAGENLVKRSTKISWYNGGSLLDALYKYAKKGDIKKVGALRIINQGTIPTDKGELIVGRIISGSAKVGERISILPAGKNAVIKGITVKGKKIKRAEIGDNVALKLDGKIDVDLRGTVISSSEDKPRLSDLLKARIFVTGKIEKNLHIKFNGMEIKCTGIKILHQIDTTTGKKESSSTAKVLEAVEAEVKLSSKVPVESYDVVRELGRFTLYSNGKFSGIGIVE